jgi:hypothetical protein
MNKMFGYPQLRPTVIPREKRDVFDRIGETGIQLTIAGGFNPALPELSEIYRDANVRQFAQDWLTERADIRARHEWRMERVEWAVLIFVAIGVFVDLYLVFRCF